MMKKIVTLVILLFGVVVFSQGDKNFELGKEAYNEAEYEKAITHWESVLESGKHSEALYYNLGNAHFKLKNIGPSIYYYEKALLLAPNDSEIKNNLAIAKTRTIDAIEKSPENIFTKWYKNISSFLSFNGWAWAAVVFVIGFTALFLFYYFSVSATRKRIFFIASFISIILAIISFSFAYLTFGDSNKPFAIIFSESVQVRNEPLLRSPVSFVIHEGTKVEIKDNETNWVRIELADGKEGWIPSAEIKQL